MRTLKYVYWNPVSFLLFPDSLTHRDVAMTHSDDTPTGAGFVSVRPDGSVRTFGDSLSLKLRPGRDDAAHIAAYLRGE